MLTVSVNKFNEFLYLNILCLPLHLLTLTNIIQSTVQLINVNVVPIKPTVGSYYTVHRQ
jgi:hypothetical protein